MRRVLVCLGVLALCLPAAGQLLSPGALARPHAELEGMANCTRCHTAGRQILDARCLECHEKLAVRIQAGEGFHARIEGDCTDCHSDHRGVDFEMVRWDTSAFDHDATGYPLEGKHAQVACARCHQKEGTYLGEQTDCLSCHADEHRGQLGTDCTACHDTQGWKPAPTFNHQSARYQLESRHVAVECDRCHAAELDSTGISFRRYRPISFGACADCHADPHRDQFAQRACTQCHTIDGFKPAHIDHQQSRYPLRGRHTRVACADCHQSEAISGTADSVVTYRPLSFGTCADCHADPHAGQFDAACSTCHRVEGWKSLPVDHDKTRFPLRGRHSTVACAACHGPGADAPPGTPARYRPLSFSACGDCHADAHTGQFEQDCATCHQVEAWKPSSFDHGRARFILEGKHVAVACDRCHALARPDDPPSLRPWRGVKFGACSDCHADGHDGQFETDCVRCHGAQGWKPSIFDHGRAQFHLDGAHERVPCDGCHKPYTQEDGTPLIRYRPLDGDCRACHG